MKKFLLCTMAVLAILPASAARWFISGAFNGWNHANANYELTEGESGVFSIDLPTFSGEFLICQGTPGNPDWDNKIGGVNILEADKAYTYVAGGGNFNCKVTVAPATVVIDTNKRTISVNGKSEENKYDTVYLVGDFGSGWSESITNYPLTLKAGTQNVWEGEYVLNATTSYFKMKAGSYVYGTGGGDISVVLGTEYTAAQSGSAYSIAPGAYYFQFVLDNNADTGVLTVTEANNMKIDYTEYYVNVLGTFNNWENNGVACNEDGVATVENLNIGTGEFKIKVWTGSSEIWYSNGEPNAVDTPIVISGNTEANMTIDGAQEGDVYNVTFDCKNGVMTITKSAADESNRDLYVLGDFNGWVPSDEWKMTRNGNVYTYTFPNGINTEEGESSFFIGDETTEWWFGPMDETMDLNLNSTVDAYFNTYGLYILKTKNERVNVTFTFNPESVIEGSEVPSILTVQSATGVEYINTDSSEAIYFNLQGVRVANPENGMFIKVQGNKASKVAL